MEIDTLKRLRDLAPGGGYIFSSGHNVQANMPAENIDRLFAIGREFGRYPIDAAAVNARIADLERMG
jgi:uroporphyrinogen decarboxylase